MNTTPLIERAKAMAEEASLDAKAFRENTVYTSDGNPVRLGANADRLDTYVDLLREMAERLAQLEAELKTVLDREAATIARHDAKCDQLEANALAARTAAQAWAKALEGEVERLRLIVRRYGDLMRMATAPAHLQETIDRCFSHAALQETPDEG